MRAIRTFMAAGHSVENVEASRIFLRRQVMIPAGIIDLGDGAIHGFPFANVIRSLPVTASKSPDVAVGRGRLLIEPESAPARRRRTAAAQTPDAL